MNGPRWTARDWFTPWLLCGAALFSNAMSSQRLLPLLVSLLAWIAVPLRPGPIRFRAWTGRGIAGLYAFSIALGVLTPGASPWAVLDLPAWAFLAFALHQLHARGSGGKLSWLRFHSLVATILPALRTSPEGMVAVVVWLLVALPELRTDSVRTLGTKASAWRPAWALRFLAVLVVGVVLLVGTSRLRTEWVQREGISFRSGAVPGLSRDGTLGSLREAYGSELFDEVSARAWGESDPGPLTGTVFQVYGRGRWIAFPEGPVLKSDRNVNEAAVHCLADDRLQPPTHWIRPASDPQGLPWIPEGSDCVGAVGEEAHGHPAGHIAVRDLSVSRGWFVFSQRRRDTLILPADFKVPAELGPTLDSALAEVRTFVVPGDPVGDLRPALSRWFQARFRYSLDPALHQGEEPVRGFLRSRQGFCEHFATLGTLLLRRSGWPSRYIKGWTSPENSGSGLWTWRRGMAHAWVRTLPPGGTWQAFDPTPAGEVLRPAGPGPWGRRFERAVAWGQQLWHQVRDGSWRDRLDVLERLGEQSWGWLLALPVLGLSLVGWKRYRKQAREPVWNLRLRKAEERLRRLGHVREAGETVSAFLARLPEGADPRAKAELETYVRERFRRVH